MSAPRYTVPDSVKALALGRAVFDGRAGGAAHPNRYAFRPTGAHPSRSTGHPIRLTINHDHIARVFAEREARDRLVPDWHANLMGAI